VGLLGQPTPLANSSPADLVRTIPARSEEEGARAGSRENNLLRHGDLLHVLKGSEASHLEERRSRQRFPIRMDVSYQLIQDRSIGGKGITLDISSAAVRFSSEGQQLSPRDLVEIIAPWPVLLNGKVPLKLVIHGMVVRAGGAEVVVTIERYEFRTCRVKNA